MTPEEMRESRVDVRPQRKDYQLEFTVPDLTTPWPAQSILNDLHYSMAGHPALSSGIFVGKRPPIIANVGRLQPLGGPGILLHNVVVWPQPRHPGRDLIIVNEWTCPIGLFNAFMSRLDEQSLRLLFVVRDVDAMDPRPIMYQVEVLNYRELGRGFELEVTSRSWEPEDHCGLELLAETYPKISSAKQVAETHFEYTVWCGSCRQLAMAGDFI